MLPLGFILSRRGTSADVLIWDRGGPQWAKGHFQDYQVGVNFIVLLIVPCFWEGGGVDTIFVAKQFALVRGHLGGG